MEILQKEWIQVYDPGPNIKEAGCNVIQTCAKKIVKSMHSLQVGSGSDSPEQLLGNFKEKYKVNNKMKDYKILFFSLGITCVTYPTVDHC